MDDDVPVGMSQPLDIVWKRGSAPLGRGEAPSPHGQDSIRAEEHPKRTGA
jgi:hypothetical protein